MKTGWLLYDTCDYQNNRAFASYMQEKGVAIGLDVQLVLTENLRFPLTTVPDFVISRQRDHLLSARLEVLGIPVFNSSRVCEICNDKRSTHAFLLGLPMMQTDVVLPGQSCTPKPDAFPLIVKPAKGHGGDRVALTQDQLELQTAIDAISPMPALVQKLASGAGQDLRVYVLFGKIIAAVLRTAKEGVVSNYKLGGTVELHTLNAAEKQLAEQVIARFTEKNAPLSFAGIDLIYHQGSLVVNEVEDVVGSRMLYKVSDIDCIDLYIRAIAQRL